MNCNDFQMASKYDDDDPGYADSKYSDDGGMDSKFSAGDSSEAKGSSAGSGDVGVVLPPIVQVDLCPTVLRTL